MSIPGMAGVLAALTTACPAWAHSAHAASGAGIDNQFRQYDKNSDGKLTADEIPGLFKQMDKHGEGVAFTVQIQCYSGPVCIDLKRLATAAIMEGR
jgi:hypothetical protein